MNESDILLAQVKKQTNFFFLLFKFVHPKPVEKKTKKSFGILAEEIFVMSILDRSGLDPNSIHNNVKCKLDY